MDTRQPAQQTKELTYRVGMKKGKIVLDADGKPIHTSKKTIKRSSPGSYINAYTISALPKSLYAKLAQPAPFISARRARATWPLIGATALAIAALHVWLVLSLAAVSSTGH